MTNSSRTSTGHRSTPRRTPILSALAVLVPLLTVGTVALVRPAQTEPPPGIAPQSQALTRADTACPTAVAGAEEIRVRAGGRGQVTVRAVGGAPEEPSPVAVTPDRVAVVDQAAVALVTGQDAVAPGLLAVRAGGSPVAAISCPAPSNDQWFSGLGGQFEHSSVIELVNPDQGAAVVDLSIRTAKGPVSAPALRGLSVPGRSVRRIDLAKELPRTSLMSLAVTVSRGRLSVSVADTLAQVGAAQPVRDWIPAQEEPAESALLLGLVPGDGSRTLSLTNPGDDEISVQVEVVSESSTFTPTDWEEIRVAPGTVKAVPVAGLANQIRRGALGLQLTSSGPVVAGLRQLAATDVSHLAPSIAQDGIARTLLPGGSARLVLGGATAEGSVVVMAHASNGERVLRRQITLGTARAAEVTLPQRAASVQIQTKGTPVAGVVVLGGAGHALLPLVQPAEKGDVPGVRPALR